MGTGEAFVKQLRPAGCAVFLGIMILTTIMLFTVKGMPIEGYTAPKGSDYYAENLDELSAELNENLLPLIDDGASCTVKDGKIIVTAPAENMALVHNGIVYYYDEKLFEFNEE